MGDQRPELEQIVLGNGKLIWHNLVALVRPKRALARLHVQNEADFILQLQQDKVILVGAHQGVFELLPVYIQSLGLKVQVPYIHRGLQIWWNRWLRKRSGAQTIAHPQIHLQLRSWISKGGRIATLCDQGPSQTLAPVLGDPCPLALQLPMHLRHHGWQVVFFRILEKHGVYHLEWQALDYQESLHLSFGEFLSQGIQKSPEQWVWHYPLHFPMQPQYLKAPR